MEKSSDGSKSLWLVLKQAERVLDRWGIPDPRLEAEVLLAHVLKTDRTKLYLNRQLLINPEQLKAYHKCIYHRIKGMPTAYITGHKEFFSMDFKVSRSVLIPRPETEILVETCEKLIKKKIPCLAEGEPVNLVDLGTGSGIIAISIAKLIKNCKVYAVDKSDYALKTARENAEQLGVSERIVFIKGDLFKALDPMNLEGKVSGVISNPPYIPTGEIDCLQREVKLYEPRIALDGGKDGLEFYRRIIPGSLRFLNSGGFIALEVGYNQASDVKQMLIENGYTDISVVPDYSGIERVITATTE